MDAPAYKKVQLNEEYCEENYGEELYQRLLILTLLRPHFHGSRGRFSAVKTSQHQQPLVLVELIQNQCKDEDAYNRNTDEFQQRFKDVVA